MTENVTSKHPVLSIHSSDGIWAAAAIPMPTTVKSRLQARFHMGGYSNG